MPVRRVEADHSVFAPQVLERRFLVAHERDDDLAIPGRVRPPHQREIAVEDSGFDHRVAGNLERIVLACAEQGGRHRQRAVGFKRFDGHASGNAAMQGDLDDVVGRGGHGPGWNGDARNHVVGRSRGPLAGIHVLRLAQHLERARAVGQAADEAAFLERRDQPVHAGLALEVERILHFLERR